MTVWDAIMPGLCVRVGAKVIFYVAKRPPGSKKFVWSKLGDYPAMSLAKARSDAGQVLSAIIEGRPPSPPERGAVTFADAAEQFIVTCLPGKRSAKEKEGTIRRELIPALGERPIASISHNDLVSLLKNIADRSERRNSGRLKSGGPHAARKARAELGPLLKWAAFNRIGGLQSNPSGAIPNTELLRGKKYNKTRDHVLRDDELRFIWLAAIDTPYPFGTLIRALILTGQRLNEIASAGWPEIDEGTGCLVIPSERMKNGQQHALPLTGRMRTLLDELPRIDGGDFLFSTTFGKRPVSGFSKFKARLDRDIAALAGPGRVEHWQLHDIRRTVRTGLSRAGVLPFHAELVIGHRQSGVHGVYDRFRYNAEKLDALRRWEQLLLQILDPPPANVVDLSESMRAMTAV